jgi:hypothetical protein
MFSWNRHEHFLPIVDLQRYHPNLRECPFVFVQGDTMQTVCNNINGVVVFLTLELSEINKDMRSLPKP